MRRVTLLYLCLILALISQAQSGLTAADWQSDLRFLQQTLHKEYPFLFKNITAEAFDAAADKLYKDMPAMQDHERVAGLTRMVSSIKYGHTRLRWRDAPVKFHIAPINFYWFSDGVFVEGTTRNYAKILGAKLLKVEGMPVEKVLEAIKPLVPSENDQYFKANGLDYLGNPEALHAQRVSKSLRSSITYTFEKDGKTFEQAVATADAYILPRDYSFTTPGADWLSARDSSSTPYYLKQIKKAYYYEYLPESKTVYVRHSDITDEPGQPTALFYKEILSFIDEHDVDRLVLDVRLNGGGNNYLNKPVITGIISNKKINQPGKFFVIIGRETFSAAQNLVNEFSNYTNVIFVGEPTSENINFYGDNSTVVLPRTKTGVRLSYAWWQDKPQWENDQWLAPQIAADMSFKDYITNRDPSLEACLKINETNAVMDPMGHLQELFMTGKMEELETEASKMVSNPSYKYIGLEGKLISSGYRLLTIKKVEPAILLFQMNTRLFPSSVDAWNGLAAAYSAANQKDKAIEAYNKVIQIDTNGPAGEAARKMIKEIKAGK